jgi:hypothetical protein
MSVVFARLYGQSPAACASVDLHDQETIAKAIFGKTIRQEPDTIPDEGRKYAEPGMGTTVPARASR